MIRLRMMTKQIVSFKPHTNFLVYCLKIKPMNSSQFGKNLKLKDGTILDPFTDP